MRELDPRLETVPWLEDEPCQVCDTALAEHLIYGAGELTARRLCDGCLWDAVHPPDEGMAADA